MIVTIPKYPVMTYCWVIHMKTSLTPKGPISEHRIQFMERCANNLIYPHTEDNILGKLPSQMKGKRHYRGLGNNECP